jgi:hypothetical protein
MQQYKVSLALVNHLLQSLYAERMMLAVAGLQFVRAKFAGATNNHSLRSPLSKPLAACANKHDLTTCGLPPGELRSAAPYSQNTRTRVYGTYCC